MRALRKLQDAGHSLLVIEHNLDVIRASDWIVDLGPEGGEAGGEVVCIGTPDDVKAHPSSHTGLALRDYEGRRWAWAHPWPKKAAPLQSVCCEAPALRGRPTKPSASSTRANTTCAT
jgi:excinuclease ABC subunit A